VLLSLCRLQPQAGGPALECRTVRRRAGLAPDHHVGGVRGDVPPRAGGQPCERAGCGPECGQAAVSGGRGPVSGGLRDPAAAVFGGLDRTLQVPRAALEPGPRRCRGLRAAAPVPAHGAGGPAEPRPARLCDGRRVVRGAGPIAGRLRRDPGRSGALPRRPAPAGRCHPGAAARRRTGHRPAQCARSDRDDRHPGRRRRRRGGRLALLPLHAHRRGTGGADRCGPDVRAGLAGGDESGDERADP
jgi:hypothetical protein